MDEVNLRKPGPVDVANETGLERSMSNIPAMNSESDYECQNAWEGVASEESTDTTRVWSDNTPYEPTRSESEEKPDDPDPTQWPPQPYV
jgi:hypothetical protein